jgi:hypothetical protein
MTVFAKQYGRMGNGLFQKAAAIGYAMKHKLRYDLSPKVPIGPQHWELKERGHNYQEIPFYPDFYHQKIILNGYWQSSRYFDHCREEVLKAFGYDWSLKEGWCSIHVRRGDYLLYPDKHPVVPYDYLKLAVVLIFQQTGCENFHVFSDDIPWCKSVFDNCKHNIVYSEGRTAEEDLVLGSCCEHNIISNSTFSWWQAWLNRNPDKIVISPSKDNWFGPGNSNLCTDDLIPNEWIKIKY